MKRVFHTFANIISLVVGVAFAQLASSSLLAQDVITNVMSPVVSYQYFDELGNSGANSIVISPIASYQYCESPPATSVLFLENHSGELLLSIQRCACGTAFLHGLVTDTSGVPLVGATVRATIYLQPVAQTITDANGNYELASVAPGNYDLSAWDATHQTSMRGLTLSASTAEQDFQLKAVATATIHATSQSVDYGELHGW